MVHCNITHICNRKSVKWSSLNVENKMPDANCVFRPGAKEVEQHSYRISSLINWAPIRRVHLSVETHAFSGWTDSELVAAEDLMLNLSYRVILFIYTAHSWRPARPAPAVDLLFFKLQTRKAFSVSNGLPQQAALKSTYKACEKTELSARCHVCLRVSLWWYEA